MRSPLAALVLCATACVARPTPAAPDPGPTEHPALVKRPFTAEQIREAMPKGARWVFEINGPYAPPSLQTIEVIRADERTATMRVTGFGPSKTVFENGPPPTTTSTSTWEELAAQASFPADKTVIEDVKMETPAGVFDAWLYTVSEEQRVRRLYFAKSRPGPPIKYVQEDDGKLFLWTVLVEE